MIRPRLQLRLAWGLALGLVAACGGSSGGREVGDELGDSSAESESSDSETSDSETSESETSESESAESDSTDTSETDDSSESTTGDPEDCDTNPIPWCDAQALPTPNGVPIEPEGLGGCPPGMARVEDFCIDRWEAALVEILPNDGLDPWSPFESPGDATVRAVSGPGLVPQGYISQVRAEAACQLAGKRLCTDAEWLRACQGASGNTYPFGDAASPGTCNDARACHPAIQYFETAEDWIWSELDHPCLNQLPAGLAETGAHAGCVSEDGIFDMMGNLHEWTADPEGTFRGGFYVDTVINGPGCTYKTAAHTVTYWDYSTGFRCCTD